MSVALPRIKFDYDTALQDERSKMLAEAGAKLGYQPAQSDSFLCQLLKLGIVPFRTQAVKNYQTSKTRKKLWTGTRNWLYWMSANIAVLSAWLTVGIITHFNSVAVWPLGIIGVLSTIAMGMSCEMIGHGRLIEHVWKTYSIAQYEGRIPDHVLMAALEITKNIPGSYVQIEGLAEREEYHEYPQDDPFLIAYMNGQGYYIEQWDEKDLPRIE